MAALTGQMMQMPLMISSLIVHAARHAAHTEIVSKRVEGDLHRYTWAEAEKRSRQVAQALARMGCAPGDRVGTLAWNGYRHLEIYYGSSGSGLVCHTINPRLFPEQIAWIANDAEDKVLCFDLTFLPLIEKLAPQLSSVKHFVVMTDRAHMPPQTSIENLRCYEELVDDADGSFEWPQFDENTASSICYTSGTTGHPKGARLQPPLHAAACLRVGAAGRHGVLRPGRDPAGRPDVPRQCLGNPLLGRARRRQARDAGASPGRQVALRAVRGREGHVQRRRAHGLAGAAQRT